MTAQPSTNTYPRHPWRAALLAASLGPWGLLYTSNVLAVFALALALLALGPLMTGLLWRAVALGLCAGVAYLWAAHRPDLRRFPTLERLDRPGWFKAGLLLLGMVGAFYLVTRTVHTVTSLNGPSMAPTILTGERVHVALAPVLRQRIERGTVVQYLSPIDPGKVALSRVVAVGNDRVEIKRGLLYVNGKAADDPERIAALQAAGCLRDAMPINNDVAYVQAPEGRALLPGNRVPLGHVFLLADNRFDNFADSRVFGPLPVANIRGTVTPARRSPVGLKTQDCTLPQRF